MSEKTPDFSDDFLSDISTEDFVKTTPPKKYKVILHNDNYTTMEFVVHVLVNIFNKHIDEATALMLRIHNSGKATAGIYSKEIAETKISITHKLAAQQQFPLKATMEEE